MRISGRRAGGGTLRGVERDEREVDATRAPDRGGGRFVVDVVCVVVRVELDLDRRRKRGMRTTRKPNMTRVHS
jgi:hypothetical protein